GCANNLRGAYYANGHSFAVGNNESILQSEFNGPPILQASRPPSPDGFQFSVNGEVGASYRLQVSSDLKTWADVVSFTNSQLITPWRDTDALPSQRFYRVVSP